MFDHISKTIAYVVSFKTRMILNLSLETYCASSELNGEGLFKHFIYERRECTVAYLNLL